MRLASFTSALFSAVVLASASDASAQVETSPVTEESRPPAPRPEPELGPRRDPTLFGAGVASTVVGGVAVPLGAWLVIANFLHGLEQDFSCIAPQQGQQCRSSSDGTGIAGGVLIASGVVLLAAGIPMIVVGGKRLRKESAFDPVVLRF